jgi:hypothetical protein
MWPEVIYWETSIVAAITDQLLFILKQGGEISEGFVLGWCFFLTGRSLIFIPFLVQIAGVLVVVTVETQKLPVATIRWVVVVVVILMMDGSFTKPLA